MRPFAGPPLPRLVRRDVLRRAAACKKAARGSAEERWPDRSLNFLIRGDRLKFCRLHLCLRPAGRFRVGRISLSANRTCEGARSRPAQGPGTPARHALASFVFWEGSNHFGRVAEPRSESHASFHRPKAVHGQSYDSRISPRVATARAGQLVAAPDARPFVGPALPRLGSARRVASRCWNRKAARRVSSQSVGPTALLLF